MVCTCICSSSHGTGVVVVVMKVVRVELKLGSVTTGDCGFTDTRWATSGMTGGFVPLVV